MKKYFWAILLAIPFALTAQDDDKSYTMYQTIYLDGDNTKTNELGEGLKAHNKKYHNTAPHEAVVFSVNTGPRAGDLVWMMGPCTFSDIDNRPKGDHGKDWRDNVLANCTDTGPVEYWKRNDELSRSSTKQQPITRIRF